MAQQQKEGYVYNGPPIQMTACESSQIKAHGYDAVSQTMEVHFNSGGVYHYVGVEPARYSEFVESESKGRYLHTNIKGFYPAHRVTAGDEAQAA